MDIIKKYEERIKFYKNRLEKSNNSIERAELSDKISSLTNEINEMKGKKMEKKVSEQIDAPTIVDRGENRPSLNRGQVIGSREIFSIDL